MRRFNQGLQKTAAGIARDNARNAGHKFYIGSVCEANPEHGGERYTRNAACRQCAREYDRIPLKERKNVTAQRQQKRRTSPKYDELAFMRPVMIVGSPERVTAK